MSLLNSVLGAVISKGMGGGGGGQSDLVGSIIGGLLQQGGGAGGILDAFRKAGHGAQADSWQGTGQNMPIDGADIMKVLGGMMGGGAAAPQAGGSLGGMLGGLLGGGAAQPAQGAMGGLGGLEQILAQTGMSHDQLGGLLSKALPDVLSGMTPNGQVENHSDDMMSSVLKGVLGNLGK